MVFDPLIFLAVIVAGFLGLGAVMFLGFSKLAKTVDRQTAYEHRRQKILIGREKAVLAASLIGEINENKNKCEAFITIYTEMLRALRDETRKPAYQQTGDFVHKSPSLSRTVYDGNVANLSMLEPSVATKLASIYATIDSDPEYLSLEPDMPLETARRMVEMVIRNAEAIDGSLADVLPSLEVMVRNAPKMAI